VWTTAGPSCATPLTQKASQSGPLSATLPCPEDGRLAVIDCDVASHGLTQLRLLVSRRQPKAWNGKNANLAFDFDDALLRLDDALLQLADPGLELLDELTECAILGLKVDVARYGG
jgi:hypothetical protein